MAPVAVPPLEDLSLESAPKKEKKEDEGDDDAGDDDEVDDEGDADAGAEGGAKKKKKKKKRQLTFFSGPELTCSQEEEDDSGAERTATSWVEQDLQEWRLPRRRGGRVQGRVSLLSFAYTTILSVVAPHV